MAYYNNNYPNYAYGPNYAYNPNYQSQQTSSCFVPIPSEDMARSYQVARGTSVTFRDENLPYIYIKTLGVGQLDSPLFEKYRLIKEDSQNAQKEPKEETMDNLPIYITKSEFEPFRDELETLKEYVGKIRKELGDE